MDICLINHDCCEVLSETHKESYVFLVIYKPTKVKKKTGEMSLLFIEVGNYLLLAFVADSLVQSMV